MKKITYSLVLPLHNEEESLEPLWKEIQPVMTKLKKNWEAIFINDGSTDDSQTIIEHLLENNTNIQLINFHTNQGKSAGLMAGFRAAQGDIIITMDADLQDDPNEIPKLLEKLDEGYDLVSGYKKERHDPIHKTVPSRIVNGLARAFSGLNIHDINCGFKVYRREVVESLFIYGELYRYIPILAIGEGFRVSEAVVNHRARKYGKSKFGISRARGVFDLLTVLFRINFIKRPLHFFGTIGTIAFLLGIVVCGYLSYLHFAHKASIGDRPLLLLGILLIISGIQLICTGLLAEIVTFYNQRDELRLINELAKKQQISDNS